MTTQSSLADLRRIIVDPNATEEMKLMVVSIAYKMGKNEGHCQGFQEGVEKMRTSAQSIIEKQFAQIGSPKANITTEN